MTSTTSGAGPSSSAPPLSTTSGLTLAGTHPTIGAPPGSTSSIPASGAMANAAGVASSMSTDDKVTAISQRLDQLTTLMNTMMMNMAQGPAVPNLTGWPVASVLQTGVSAPPTMGAVATFPSATVPPANLQTIRLPLPTSAGSHSPSVQSSQLLPTIPTVNIQASAFPQSSQSLLANAVQTVWATQHSTPLQNVLLPPASTPQQHLPLQLPQQVPFSQHQFPQQPQQVSLSQQQHVPQLPLQQFAQQVTPQQPVYTGAFPGTQPSAHQQSAAHSDRGSHSDVANGGNARNAAPRGDAYDSDVLEDNARRSHRDSDVSTASRRRGRGRGRDRVRTEAQPRQSRHSDSENDDPNDDYATNRERLETYPKTLAIKQFLWEDKNQDFEIWINQFENAVNRGTNPHSQKRHFKYCLQWLPSYLGPDAYTVWKRSVHRKKDWVALKTELRQEYEDPIIRSEWKSNLKAYTWDEGKESLHTYCSKVKRYVDTFDTDLADAPVARQGQYYIRFVSGLPDDYQKQIRMAMPTKKQCIDKAHDVSIRYQATKKGKQPRSETAAVVSFEDPSMPSRVTQNETEIIRLKNRIAKVEGENPPAPAADRRSAYRPPHARGSPSGYRKPYPSGSPSGYRTSYTGGSPHRMLSQGRDAGFSSDSSQRVKDRMDRFATWRKSGFQNGNRRTNSFNRNSRTGQSDQAPQQRQAGAEQQHPREREAPHTSAASLEKGSELQSEVESEPEDLDDTVMQFAAAMEEKHMQEYEDFCAFKDMHQGEFLPGNY